jgi:hypothetical protein
VCHQTVLYVVIQNIILHYILYCFVYDSIFISSTTLNLYYQRSLRRELYHVGMWPNPRSRSRRDRKPHEVVTTRDVTENLQWPRTGRSDRAHGLVIPCGPNSRAGPATWPGCSSLPRQRVRGCRPPRPPFFHPRSPRAAD